MAERVGDMEFTAKADVEFHRTLAKMTHNPLFTILLDSIGDILLEIRLEVMVMSDEPLRGINFHRRILAQVAAGDSKGARLVMEEHLADAENIWRELGHGVALHSTAKSTEA
jgi:DNA-binding FadR family transcriptional regulator